MGFNEWYTLFTRFCKDIVFSQQRPTHLATHKLAAQKSRNSNAAQREAETFLQILNA